MYLGTDHPFFPPLPQENVVTKQESLNDEEEEEWLSVTTNYRAINMTFEPGDAEGILGKNAIRLLRLYQE